LNTHAMKRFLQRLVVILSAMRLLPHVCVYAVHDKDGLVRSDIDRWSHILFRKSALSEWGRLWMLLWLLTLYPEFRNLFYKRTGLVGRIFGPLCKPMSTLFIDTEDIGRGLFIQHGFATIVSAKRIGDNCWINQQVTVGYSAKGGRPTLEDGVVVNAGAKIIGDITVGRETVIGANAVVVKSTPAGATVVGVPARVIKIKPVSPRQP